MFPTPATWQMPRSQWAQKNHKEHGNTHYHEGLLVCVVGYSVLPQTVPLLLLTELSPLFCTLQSASRGQHCLCSPITISIAIAHAQRGVWEVFALLRCCAALDGSLSNIAEGCKPWHCSWTTLLLDPYHPTVTQHAWIQCQRSWYLYCSAQCLSFLCHSVSRLYFVYRANVT